MVARMLSRKLRVVPFAAAGLSVCLVSASCSSDKTKPPPSQATSSETIVPGRAGGVYEDSVTAYATVRGVDPATRKVTLETADGNRATFTAPPEVRNLDQLRSGDRVKATFTERLTVLVNQDATPGGDYATASARTPKGAKPGAIVAESYEAVASVKSIDTAKRTATLEFADGKTIPVPVREDVDLTRYKAGDHVLIRVTDVLSVLTSSP